MSDSEDAPATPSNAQIESTLRRIVARTYKTDHDNLTVKRVRKAIEDELDLPESWLKQHDVWAAKSKELITSEAKRLEAAGGNDSDEDEPIAKKPPKKTNGMAAAKSTSKKRKAPDELKKSAKTKPKPRKRRRVSSDEEDDASESEPLSSVGENDTPSPAAKKTAARPKVAPKKARSKTVVDSDDEDNNQEDVKMADASPEPDAAPAKESDAREEEEEDDPRTSSAPPPKIDGHESESSLSSLLDEPPAKKIKRQKKSQSAKSSKAKPTAAKAKPAAKKDAKEVTPEDEEIKRLQGWLLKCGIRKVWGKELKPFETPKAKIARLKSMLADVGLTGRYSVEKARQIKEQRELAADLEAVTAFDQKWGQKKDSGRPKGRGDMARDLGLDPSLIDDESDDE